MGNFCGVHGLILTCSARQHRAALPIFRLVLWSWWAARGPWPWASLLAHSLHVCPVCSPLLALVQGWSSEEPVRLWASAFRTRLGTRCWQHVGPALYHLPVCGHEPGVPG